MRDIFIPRPPDLSPPVSPMTWQSSAKSTVGSALESRAMGASAGSVWKVSAHIQTQHTTNMYAHRCKMSEVGGDLVACSWIRTVTWIIGWCVVRQLGGCFYLTHRCPGAFFPSQSHCHHNRSLAIVGSMDTKAWETIKPSLGCFMETASGAKIWKKKKKKKKARCISLSSYGKVRTAFYHVICFNASTFNFEWTSLKYKQFSAVMFFCVVTNSYVEKKWKKKISFISGINYFYIFP